MPKSNLDEIIENSYPRIETMEDFSMIQHRLSYGACQSIGMALAKLKLLEEQGCEVKE